MGELLSVGPDQSSLPCGGSARAVSAPSVAAVEAHLGDLAEAAADLIELANQNGGRDNISVILVRVPPEFLPVTGWAQRWLAKKRG